ncbi:hypothetical protein [Rufibacter latericius]|uniref:hypothetical protein n=1 Tax=Rufibacter latericius TaxID=2487040 RepID=UPI000F6297D0|nr:hypothetical protein [Rufibacter latericius]
MDIQRLEKERNRIYAFACNELDLDERINQHIDQFEEPANHTFFVRVLSGQEDGGKSESDAEVSVIFKSVTLTPERETLPVINFKVDGKYSVRIGPVREYHTKYTLYATVEDFERKLQDYIPLLDRQDSLINVLLITYDPNAAMYQPLDLWINIYFNEKEEMPFMKVNGNTSQRVLDFRAFIDDLSASGIFSKL